MLANQYTKKLLYLLYCLSSLCLYKNILILVIEMLNNKNNVYIRIFIFKSKNRKLNN